MWRADPTGWLARSYRIEEKGAVVATIGFGAWSERGTLELAGERYPIEGEGFWNRRFHLTHEGKRIATARRTGAFRRGFHLVHGHDECQLDPSGVFSRSFQLTRRGRQLGQISALGAFSRSAHIDLDEELAPELRLFAFWLVLLAWRRAVATAAAT